MIMCLDVRCYYYYYYYNIRIAHEFKRVRIRGAGVARWGT